MGEILPAEEGRCSKCGEPISGSEPEVILRHPDHPGDDLYFHEGEECSETALWLAETYPDEWSAVMLMPQHWDLPPLPPTPDVCVMCGHRILPSEPDVILLHSQVEGQCHRFHERCALLAYQLVEDDPRTWGLIHRFVNEEAN